MPHLDARLLGGVDEDPVEQVPARRIERLDPGPGLDGHLDVLPVRVVEGGPPDRRRARRHEGVQDAPPGQLQDPRAHQRVRGEGVAAAPAPVDEGDPEAGPGQEQGRGGAGHPATHHDDVVAAHAADS